VKSENCDVDKFLETNSYFNKSKEEIKMLFQAFRDPEMFKDIISSFGLSEEKFQEEDPKSISAFKKVRESIIKDVYLLIHDIHKTPELPNLTEPISKIEALVSPKRDKSGIVR
jgi:hypothetical protein